MRAVPILDGAAAIRWIARKLCASALSVLALGAWPAWARLQAEVVEFGETTAKREHPAQQTPTDRSLTPRTEIEGIRFVSHTSDVEAQLCLRFGVSIRLIPDPGEPPPLELIGSIRHPRLTRPDNVSSVEDSFPTPVNGTTSYVGWTFDQPWEMQPGNWTIAFLSEGRVLASKTFAVAVPTPTGSMCSSPVS